MVVGREVGRFVVGVLRRWGGREGSLGALDGQRVAEAEHNQPTSQPTSQPINQPSNQPTKTNCIKVLQNTVTWWAATLIPVFSQSAFTLSGSLIHCTHHSIQSEQCSTHLDVYARTAQHTCVEHSTAVGPYL